MASQSQFHLCKWLHPSFSRSNADYYNFNFLAPWESRDFLVSHVPVQNEIFLPPQGHLYYKMSCLCMWNKRETFFSDYKMNHKAAEEFHDLCVKSSIRDLDYWSQPGTATLLPPRGSDNKTQLLGKIIARRHQNVSPHASILLALKGFYLPENSPVERSTITRNRVGVTVFLSNLLLFICFLSTMFHLAAQARNLVDIPDFSPLPFLKSPGTHYVLTVLTLQCYSDPSVFQMVTRFILVIIL